MSEIKNGELGLYGPEHFKCNHIMTLGFKGLTNTLTRGMELEPECPRVLLKQ